ncbi:Glutamate--tRNA ligase mitochondrial [Coemansia interrupta]|uniref:Glutamate--tRNA ligase, mitochondrial n=1 Tax=Coemansia interrupta TaxID=1126814 RepID=A0A9W8LEH0_9FUNG|nr:Glutamate--tRNA ligase mitochondrial [Coemansia interrupta]
MLSTARRLRNATSLKTASHIHTHRRPLTHAHAHAHTAAGDSVEPSGPVRVRFAPSPTGMLHLGGLRTALFNYLLARRYGGEFILRIEDTDRARLVPGAADNIARTLDWAGLRYDEGPDRPGAAGPYVQSQRADIYRAHAHELLERGAAYRCFCDTHRLAALRAEAEAQGRPPMYDRRCMQLSQGQIDEQLRAGAPHTIRLIAPEPGDAGRFRDLVYGHMHFRGPAGFDDAVLLKSDGLATYHLASVVDDHLMGITHVLRGEEWLVSTPKHRALFDAFGWRAPEYAHLPLLMNPDGSKLSKRNRDGPVQAYVDAGYLPQALVNYAALLGWHPGGEDEVHTLRDLERSFSLERLSRAKSAVSRDRLDWLNRQHLRRALADPDAARALSAQAAREVGAHVPGSVDPDAVRDALRMCAGRLTFTHELFDAAPFLFARPDLSSADAVGTLAKIPSELRLPLLQAADAALVDAKPAPAEAWTAFAKQVASAASAQPKHAMMALRFALTGQASGPKIPELLAFFPPAESRQRLARAVESLSLSQ